MGSPCLETDAWRSRPSGPPPREDTPPRDPATPCTRWLSPAHVDHTVASAHTRLPLWTGVARDAPSCHHSRKPGTGAGPTHPPLQAHQHVGQVLHLKVHQGEQRRADCKEGTSGLRHRAGRTRQRTGAGDPSGTRRWAQPAGRTTRHSRGLVHIRPSAPEPPQADPCLTASRVPLCMSPPCPLRLRPLDPHPVHPNKCSNALEL